MQKNKYRVFLDTNTLISGIFFSGNEEKLIALSEQGKLTLVVSDFVLEELVDVAERFGVPPEISRDFLLETDLEVVYWKEYQNRIDESKNLIRDEKDVPILAAVLASKPDYLITGDKDFHTTKIKNMIQIIRTLELLKLID